MLLVLAQGPASGTALYTTGQVLREYLAVATRAVAQPGLGAQRSAAVENARALRGRLSLLAEDRKVSDRLLVLVDAVGRTGTQVHDANVVATTLGHGIDTLVTSNADDFARFEALVSRVRAGSVGAPLSPPR